MKKFISVAIVIATLGVSLLGADLQSAKKLKTISAKATKLAIAKFKKDKKSNNAYNEAKSIIAKQLNEVANGGFYNIVYARVDDNTLYDKLSNKQQDILESILKSELEKLGYKVQSAKYDSIMLHWAITWE